MSLGTQFALHEIALVFFSTLAPMGAVACAFLAILAFRTKDSGARLRLRHLLGLPLAVATLGLVMASTHLGTPANVLYVATGIGRSPLSNEMLCTLPFLALTGLACLYSFAPGTSNRLMEALEVGVAALGAVCVTGISTAYAQPTILAWYSPTSMLGIGFGALTAGIPLFLLSAHIAHAGRAARSFERLALALGLVALVGAGICEVLRCVALSGMGNEMYSASELSPHYSLYLLASLCLTILAYALCFVVCPMPQRQPRRPASTTRAQRILELVRQMRGRALVTATTLSFLGFLLCRFAFYTVRFTVGIG